MRVKKNCQRQIKRVQIILSLMIRVIITRRTLMTKMQKRDDDTKGEKISFNLLPFFGNMVITMNLIIMNKKTRCI